MSLNTVMSFADFTSAEALTPFDYLCCLNRIYNGNYHYTSEATVSPILCRTSPTITSYLPNVSHDLLIPERHKVNIEHQNNPLTYPIHGSSNVQSDSLHQKLWSNKTSESSGFIDCHGGRLDVSKNSEIWRPFSPSPSKEVPEHQSGFNRSLPLIIPSRVKIEHSKTSLFKPVKKRGFRCSHCSSSFISSAQLISHLRVHTGSKPFICEYPNCPKTFARNEELTRHLRIHSGYKPHACHACGKTFGRKDHLSKHAKTHLHASEKRAYACAVPGCGHRYTRSDALTRHRTAAHATWQREEEPVVGSGQS